MTARTACLPLPAELLWQSPASGRKVTIRSERGGDRLEIESPRGEVEITVAFTAAGPLVRLHGARLELQAAEELALRCRRLSLEGSEGVSLQSGREVRIEADELRARTEHDIHLNGATIRLNCTPEGAAPAAVDGAVAMAAAMPLPAEPVRQE